MKKYSDLEYLQLPKWKRFFYALVCFIVSIPTGILNFFKKLGSGIKNFFLKVKNEFWDIYVTFRDGDWKTRLSYLVMGFGSIARGQVLRGILLLLFEIVFIVYMIFGGVYWLSKLDNLGDMGPTEEYSVIYDTFVPVYHDNSFKILLYGVLTMFFIVAFIYTWRVNVKQNKISQDIIKSGKKLKSGKDDLRSLIDDKFHMTLLSLPITGILIFTVMPIVFMILVAFTNYDFAHNGYTNNLFSWVGMDSFNRVLSWTGGSGATHDATFGEILSWTLIWAFFATFSNYFLGMLVAMMINKKGIKLKKFWRTCLVMTIAVPQFISLLYVSKMFANDGLVNGLLINLGWIDKPLPFWTDGTWARVTVIIVNIWVGIPYLMLIATGILMNIPQDLYESARVDGAGPWKQYTKITLPYMLFVTGPYLLTSFISNMNNFNVIYLLTGGAPTMSGTSLSGSPGETDLLVTWLFKMTAANDPAYNLASVIGIMVFVVVAAVSLIVYNVIPSTRNEEDFQ